MFCKTACRATEVSDSMKFLSNAGASWSSGKSAYVRPRGISVQNAGEAKEKSAQIWRRANMDGNGRWRDRGKWIISTISIGLEATQTAVRREEKVDEVKAGYS